jgi:hypothetical protein
VLELTDIEWLPALASGAGVNRRPGEVFAGRRHYRRSIMRIARTPGYMLGRAVALAFLLLAAIPAAAESVLTYHARPDRSGNYTLPQLTWDQARGLRLDTAFAPHFEGHLYAQPLFWHPPGAAAGLLIVASESNVVSAIDAANGKPVWTRTLGRPAPLSAFDCGNIDPLGITGTPVIDEANGIVYLDAMVADPSGLRHRIFALSLKDGSPLPGWTIDVADALRARGEVFD